MKSPKARKWFSRLAYLLAESEGAQIAELAVSLPLLMVIAVGIMDFGGAFNLKHKLDVVMHQATRFAANQTLADVTNTTPRSTEEIRGFVVSSLASAKLPTCGLDVAASTKQDLKWTYSASRNCPGAVTLTIDRGHTFVSGRRDPVTVEATQVTISYPYLWHFGNVIKLLVPGATYQGLSQIKTQAIVQNLS